MICALSGGVDSTVAATLVHKVLGDRLHCVFVDNGLLRYKVRGAEVQERSQKANCCAVPQGAVHLLDLQMTPSLNFDVSRRSAVRTAGCSSGLSAAPEPHAPMACKVTRRQSYIFVSFGFKALVAESD